MKLKPLLLAAVTLSTFIAGCGKRNCCVLPEVPMNGQKDGAGWTTNDVNTGYKPLSTKDTLFITAQKGEEHLIIAVAQKGIATYQPGEYKAYYFTTVGQDVITSRYQLQTDASNRFQILNYTEAQSALNANFSFSLTKIYPQGSGAPATIKFIGTVNTKLSQVELNPFH